MGVFRKRLPDILKGFHKTLTDMDDLHAAHTIEINNRMDKIAELSDQANNHNKEIDALEAERLQALAVKDKIAGLIGA